MSWAVRLYPAAFRREFGDEVAEVYREATRDAGPLGRMRETGDVIGHALRMRLGLGSAGRWFGAVVAVAVAVPYAVSWLRFLVPVAGGLLLAGRQAFVRLRTAPAVPAAGLPFLVLAELTGALAVYLALPLLLVVLGAAVAVSVRRRRGGSGPLVGA
ncbi:hypothetical protein [Streptomyces sp. NPDC101132]|uniref:hypothetical protein n=1 Tax=Streptomyces sp. NPDC101132 TaxID=3366110 RepID=UPI00381DF81A